MKISANHEYDYDVIVVGAGPAGSEAAKTLGVNGVKVAIIEAKAVGGTCINRGCIPAKTMLYMAQMYRQLKKMGQYGIKVNLDQVELDYAGMMSYRDQMIAGLQDDLKSEFKRDNVELIEAYAELIDPQTLQLSDGRKLTADQIILATGGRARKFPGFIDGDQRFLTSDNIFALQHLPKSITIVGGGPVGTEFASYYRSFGVEVHIVDRGKTFFDYYDHRLGMKLAEEFKKQGIDVHNETEIKSIKTSGELLQIELVNGKEIESEYILSAIGVEVLSDYIKIDLEMDKSGRIIVAENFETNYSHIYAVGDLIGRAGTAYGAQREAKNIAYQLLGKDTTLVPIDYTAITDVVFTYPEIGTCGYSRQELKQQGIQFECRQIDYQVNAKARIRGESAGSIWMYSEPDQGRILGVHIIGASATELIHAIPILLLSKMTISDYLKAVWGHPVMAELLKEVMEHPIQCEL